MQIASAVKSDFAPTVVSVLFLTVAFVIVRGLATPWFWLTFLLGFLIQVVALVAAVSFAARNTIILVGQYMFFDYLRGVRYGNAMDVFKALVKYATDDSIEMHSLSGFIFECSKICTRTAAGKITDFGTDLIITRPVNAINASKDICLQTFDAVRNYTFGNYFNPIPALVIPSGIKAAFSGGEKIEEKLPLVVLEDSVKDVPETRTILNSSINIIENYTKTTKEKYVIESYVSGTIVAAKDITDSSLMVTETFYMMIVDVFHGKTYVPVIACRVDDSNYYFPASCPHFWKAAPRGTLGYVNLQHVPRKQAYRYSREAPCPNLYGVDLMFRQLQKPGATIRAMKLNF